MANKNNIYFETFIEMTELSCQAAQALHHALTNFDPEILPVMRTKLHDIEHKEDDVKHNMMQKLAREFVTPIEREDIISLANELDEVTDIIEDVLIRIYMYNIRSIIPEALTFTELIVRCCEALQVAAREFPNFHKSETLHGAIVDVNSLEEEGDTLYINATRSLYVQGGDPLTVVAWSETLDRLEECCDACEHVANVMESVVMKNS